MAERVIDELQKIYDDTNTGVPATKKLQFATMVQRLVVSDLPSHETSALAASAGLATGSLFLTTAGALMQVV